MINQRWYLASSLLPATNSQYPQHEPSNGIISILDLVSVNINWTNVHSGVFPSWRFIFNLRCCKDELT
jgi:hypothetical protein